MKNMSGMMLKWIFSLFLALRFYSGILYSQEWSEPVIINPTQSQLGSDDPDFCIDHDGHIHCVWSVIHGSNFYRIWYSKSEDDGETWTPIYNISQNNSKWMAEPQIISDSQGTIHLVYTDDVGSSSHKIVYKTNDGNDPSIWSESDTLNQGYYAGYRNRLVIDHNDRLYCFWYINSGYGKMYYRFMDVGITDWGDVIMPYDTAFFYRIAVGSDNSLNIAGSAKSPYEIKRRVIFYKYINSIWAIPEIVSPQTNTSYYDMSLDTQDYPHIVWMQYSLGNGTGIDSSMYRYKNEDGWQPMEFIHSDIVEASIIVDNADNIHIIESENLNDMDLLTEYQKVNGLWEATIIEENIGIELIRLLCKNGFIYMVYGRKDTNDDINIMFRKKAVISTAVENSAEFQPSVKIFPNPASDEITCRFTSAQKENLEAKIYDQRGNEIRTLYKGEKQEGEIKLSWDGKDYKGERVDRGIYILSIQSKKEIITKKIIMH
jgi:hypothetical protein